MYSIKVRTFSDIQPSRLYSVESECLPGDLGFTVIVHSTDPIPALSKVFNLFREYRRDNRRAHVHEIHHAEIDWDSGKALAIGVNQSAIPASRFERCLPGNGDQGIGARAAFMSSTQVLFIGGIEDAEPLADPNPHGITTPVNLCPEMVPEEVPGINHHDLPMLPDHALPMGMFKERIDEFWDSLRRGSALLHSLHGANRAPILAAAWMHRCGYKYIDAALVDNGYLHLIEPNPILLKSIKERL